MIFTCMSEWSQFFKVCCTPTTHKKETVSKLYGSYLGLFLICGALMVEGLMSRAPRCSKALNKQKQKKIIRDGEVSPSQKGAKGLPYHVIFARKIQTLR